MYAVIEKGRVVQYVVGFIPQDAHVITVPVEVSEHRQDYEYKDGVLIKRPDPVPVFREKTLNERIAELEELLADLAELVLFGGEL